MISLKQLEKLAVDNSPVLLTAIGVVGTIGTAVLTHKSATRANRVVAKHLDNLTLHEATEFRRKDHVKLVWKIYIPPVASGITTIGCVVMANHIGSKRAAAVAAAYTISEKAYSEYKDKVIERIGENEERKIREDVVRDRLRDNPQSEENTVIIGSGDVLCYEMYAGRYFNSSVESIKKAVNEVNYQINTHGYASLSDFYNQLSIPTSKVSEEMGWTSDKLMDVDITTHLSEDGRPCVAINFVTGPVRNFSRFH